MFWFKGRAYEIEASYLAASKYAVTPVEPLG